MILYFLTYCWEVVELISIFNRFFVSSQEANSLVVSDFSTLIIHISVMIPNSFKHLQNAIIHGFFLALTSGGSFLLLPPTFILHTLQPSLASSSLGLLACFSLLCFAFGVFIDRVLYGTLGDELSSRSSIHVERPILPLIFLAFLSDHLFISAPALPFLLRPSPN